MKPPEAYRGREQTYVKHLFLERYLERVAYNICSFRDDFVYVDGFSGPWRSEDEAYEDTSFMIAGNQLRKVREGLRDRGREVRMRCFFNDSNAVAFEGLREAVKNIEDMTIEATCRDFEDVVPEIVRYVGSSFSLTFIDPTGWTGYSLQKIRPLSELRGEVIINFMFDHVNRFLEDPEPKIAETYNDLFGGPGWYEMVTERMDSGMSREDAVLDVYRERFRSAGGFKHVTSTRVLKPLSGRSYFHLIYGTRNWKGLVEFRHVEKQSVPEQESVRQVAQATHSEERTGQPDLFAPGEDQTGPLSYEAERAKQLHAGLAKLRNVLVNRRSVKYEDLLGCILEMPLIWRTDVVRWLTDLRTAGEIQIPDLKGRERTPKTGYTIIWKGDPSRTA